VPDSDGQNADLDGPVSFALGRPPAAGAAAAVVAGAGTQPGAAGGASATRALASAGRKGGERGELRTSCFS